VTDRPLEKRQVVTLHTGEMVVIQSASLDPETGLGTAFAGPAS